MSLLLAVALSCLPAWSQLESAQRRAGALVEKTKASLAPDQYEEEPGEVTEEEAHAPPSKVSATVWRSSRRDEASLEQLYPLGIRTILNLEDPGHQWEESQRLARIERRRAERGEPAWHIESLNVPMSGISRPKFSQIDRTLAVLSDSAKAPLLVHCKHGEDRTGVVIASYRVEVEKTMTIDQAATEAKALHCCHLVLIGENGLRDFLREYHRRRD